MFAFQKDRKQEKIYNCKLSKITALRGGSGDYSSYHQVLAGTKSEFSRQH